MVVRPKLGVFFFLGGGNPACKANSKKMTRSHRVWMLQEEQQSYSCKEDKESSNPPSGKQWWKWTRQEASCDPMQETFIASCG